MLYRGMRITVDNDTNGNVAVEEFNWVVRNKRISIPRSSVNAVIIKRDYDSEGGLSYLVSMHTPACKRQTLTACNDVEKDDMLTLAHVLSHLLDVELIDEVTGDDAKPKDSEGAAGGAFSPQDGPTGRMPEQIEVP